MRFICFAVLVLIAQTFLAQQQTGSVRGVVLRSGTAEPAANAKVELRPSTGRVNSVFAISDESGRFAFPSVAAGQYRLLASKSGYVPSEYRQVFPGGPAPTIAIRGGENVDSVRLEITQGGLIAGRILDRGQPAGNGRVYAVKASYELGHRVTNVVLSAVTNDLGEYSIFWLPPGRYYIVASVIDGPPETAPVTTSIGDNTLNVTIIPSLRYVFTRAISSVVSDTEMHVPMFHPGTPELKEARAIDVSPGSTIRGIDVNADTVHALHVRGTVTGVPLGANGQPVSASMTLFPLDGMNLASLAVATADSRGAFDIARVRPGSYILSTVAGTLTARVPVDVHDRDINGVRLDLRPTVAVSGRVVIEGPTSANLPRPPAVQIALLLDPVLGGFKDNAAASRPVERVVPSDSGAFTTPASAATPGYPPGDYQVIVPPVLSAPAGWTSPPALPSNLVSTNPPIALQNAYVKSIRMGDKDILQDGLRIRLTDSSRDPLVVVIAMNAGRIEGRVRNEKGQATVAATVALLPESNLRFRVAHKYAVTDVDGKFQIQGIAPGDYKLFAWLRVEKGAWQDPDFVRRHEASGTPIHIEEDSNAAVELAVIPE